VTSAKVLIIEDNTSIRQAYSNFLSKAGYEVCQGDGYDQAVASMDHSIDLALLDVELDGRSGLEILTYIRDNHPDCPAIMMSGFADKQNTIEALRLGAVEYLEKPVNPHELVQSIQHWLSMRKLKQGNPRLQDFDAMYQRLQENEKLANLANERLDFLLDSSGTTMYWADSNLNTTYISPQITALCGYSREQFTAQPGFRLECIHPDDFERVTSVLKETLQCGQSSLEYRMRHSLGHDITICEHVKATENSEGTPELTGFLTAKQ